MGGLHHIIVWPVQLYVWTEHYQDPRRRRCMHAAHHKLSKRTAGCCYLCLKQLG